MEEKEVIPFSYRICTLSSSFNIENVVSNLKNSKECKISTQILNPALIVSKRHLSVAIHHTLKSFKIKRNVARDSSTEFLIRISGRRQISKALDLYGITHDSTNVLVLVFGGTEKENNESLSDFIQTMGLEELEKEKQKLPISSLEILTEFYDCLKNPDDLEKKALELMATIDVQ